MALSVTDINHRYQPISWQIIHQSDGRLYRHLVLIFPFPKDSFYRGGHSIRVRIINLVCEPFSLVSHPAQVAEVRAHSLVFWRT